jgi:hypothetical protein
MQRLKIPSILIFVLFCFVVCIDPSDAAGVGPQEESWRNLSGTKAAIYGAAKKILQIQGFEMEKQAAEAGILITASSPMRLNLTECDCGLGGGGAVKDNRPILHVSVSISVELKRILIRATIDGDYPKDQISPKMIEDDLFDRIVQYME